MPFLSIVTRCYKRPAMLARCCESIRAQQDAALEHLLINDEVGRGVEWANAQLAAHKNRVHGDYVLILDDDDLLACSSAVTILRDVARSNDYPDLIVFRADHAELGVLPDAEVWEKKPLHGHIGGIDFITRAATWKRYIGKFAQPEGGDFHFLEALWKKKGLRVVWLDRLLTRVQRISRGRPE